MGSKFLVGFLFALPMLFLLFAFPYVVVRRIAKCFGSSEEEASVDEEELDAQ